MLSRQQLVFPFQVENCIAIPDISLDFNKILQHVHRTGHTNSLEEFLKTEVFTSLDTVAGQLALYNVLTPHVTISALDKEGFQKESIPFSLGYKALLVAIDNGKLEAVDALELITIKDKEIQKLQPRIIVSPTILRKVSFTCRLIN